MAPDQPIDEMVDGGGRLRPHWRALVAAISALGPDALAERGLRLERAFADEGITGLLPSAEPSLWRCDPVPLLLTQPEFAGLEAGLGQRARLLDAVLTDLYGPQTLLAEGLLPPGVIYADPSFLRPCRTTDGAPEGPMLHLYAADLVRGPDHQWRVLADHVDGSSGLARALENRRMMARVLPELFPSQPIGQLRPFFDIWQDSLQRLAPAGSAPGIVLLTAGHADPMWFEHVLLSRELGCALAESGDLTVRDGAVFLKTLRGLQPVNVILRRVKGDRLDPLELGGSGSGAGAGGGAGGVPGLLDAIRAGAVRVVNHPGAALSAVPAMAAFLPALCRRLLNADLALPSVPARWLGDPAVATAIGARPDGWLVRAALGAAAPAASQLERIAAEPWRLTATPALSPSMAPCAGAEGLEPRPVALRLFLVFDGAAWRAMPGGLAQALRPEDLHTARMPRQGLAKDVWVMMEEGREIHGPSQRPTPALIVRRTPGDLPSRVADNFYWLGRYLERVEGAARLQRATVTRLSRAALLPREMAELRVLLACLEQAEVIDPDLVQDASPGLVLAELGRTARDTGVAGLLRQVSDLTEMLRDRLTGDMYAVITGSLRSLRDMLDQPRTVLDEMAHAMTSVLHFTATVAGLAAENMVRGGGRLFLDLGRRVERAQSVAALLAVALAKDQPARREDGRIEAGLRMALELCDSVITYRNRYLTVLQPAPVLDLVLADEGNPRSLAYQLATARDLLAEITGDRQAGPTQQAARLLTATNELVRLVATAADQADAALALPIRLQRIEEEVAELSNRIGRLYFALLPAAHAVGLDAGDTSA